MRRTLVFCIAALFLVLLVANTQAYSNESISAKQAIDKASADIADMQARSIPISRANESLQEAIQIYQAQLALENTGVVGDYSVVINDAAQVENLTQTAIKAGDELKIFNEAYTQASKTTNLSEMQQQYDQIQQSFNEERFEDTLTLINQGYTSISNIQASQTTLRLFYDTTSNNLKNFFQNNWLKILIILLVVVVVLIIFWRTIKRMRVNLKMNHFILEKATLTNLIKKMQIQYFKSKTISETEYKVKTERFKEMIRDIDRQIPLLKEELAKIDRNKSLK